MRRWDGTDGLRIRYTQAGIVVCRGWRGEELILEPTLPIEGEALATSLRNPATKEAVDCSTTREGRQAGVSVCGSSEFLVDEGEQRSCAGNRRRS